MYQLRESRSKNALQYFEAVLKTNSRNIEALFGKAKYFELCGHFGEANQVLSMLVVVYQKFTPPLVSMIIDNVHIADTVIKVNYVLTCLGFASCSLYSCFRLRR